MFTCSTTSRKRERIVEFFLVTQKNFGRGKNKMSISSLLTWTAMSSEQNDISEWDYLVKEYRNISKHIMNQRILFLIISAPAKYYPLEQLATERKPRLPIMCLNSFFHSASYPGRWQSWCSCDADTIGFQQTLCYLAEEGR